jgi:hypothetical protein
VIIKVTTLQIYLINACCSDVVPFFSLQNGIWLANSIKMEYIINIRFLQYEDKVTFFF